MAVRVGSGDAGTDSVAPTAAAATTAADARAAAAETATATVAGVGEKNRPPPTPRARGGCPLWHALPVLAARSLPLTARAPPPTVSYLLFFVPPRRRRRRPRRVAAAFETHSCKRARREHRGGAARAREAVGTGGAERHGSWVWRRGGCGSGGDRRRFGLPVTSASASSGLSCGHQPRGWGPHRGPGLARRRGTDARLCASPRHGGGMAAVLDPVHGCVCVGRVSFLHQPGLRLGGPRYGVEEKRLN